MTGSAGDSARARGDIGHRRRKLLRYSPAVAEVLMEVGIPVHFNFDGDSMLLELQAWALHVSFENSILEQVVKPEPA